MQVPVLNPDPKMVIAMTGDLANWTSRPRPEPNFMAGRYIDIVPWQREVHGLQLWRAFGADQTNELLFHFGWPQMRQWQDLADILDQHNSSGEFVTCIFADKAGGEALGMANYMNIVPENGVIETGAIAHGHKLRQSAGATEGHYLMAKHVFEDLGYRRYEWKLNNPNQPSHNAARRFGFTFEGVFRQHQIKPYGNRDTAWYSMLDKEWPLCKAAFEAWLAPENFNGEGRQIRRLEDIRAALGE